MALFRTSFISLFFPAQCIGCETPLESSLDVLPDASSESSIKIHPAVPRQVQLANGRHTYNFHERFRRHWCIACWQGLQLDNQLQCPICAATLKQKNPLMEGCPMCDSVDLRFDRVIAVGNYGGLLQELIIKMKNLHEDQLAMQLAELAAFRLVESELYGNTDLIVPVPTHWQRRLKRGFCAAEIMAQTIASITGIRHLNRALQTARVTEKQGTLSINARFENIKNAFDLTKRAKRKTIFRGQRVLIVDDVMTSGATISELAKLIKAAGAESVNAVVIARGTGLR